MVRVKEFEINEANSQRLALARRIALLYSQNPKVKAVTVTGPVARGWIDSTANLEIQVFWEGFPSEAERQATLASLPTQPLILGAGSGGIGELYEVEGVKIELGQFPVELVEQYLREVLEGYEPDLEKQTLLAAIQHALPLYGESLVMGWQERTAHYPAGLAEAMVKQNLQFGGYWPARELLVDRDDLLLLHGLYYQVERQVLGILLGLNRIYWSQPNGNWLEQLVQQMEITPPALVLRLKQVFRLAPRSGIRLLQEIVAETLNLVETHMPEVTHGDKSL